MRTQGDLIPVATDRTEGRPVSSTSGKDQKKTRTPKAGTSRERDGDRNVGHALRSIYQKTVDEAIPSEMLDLLGKLG